MLAGRFGELGAAGREHVLIEWGDWFDAGGEPLGKRDVLEGEHDTQQRRELRCAD